MNQQQQHGNDPSPFSGPGLPFLLCRALAASVEVFLHKTGSFGERYIGKQTLIAALLIFFFPVFWPHHDPTAVVLFACAFLVRCAMVSASITARRIRGAPQPHSYYTGQPSIMRSKGKISEPQIKLILEPVLVALIGLIAKQWNEPFGTYLLIAAVGLFVAVLVSVRQDRQRALDMNDAMVDQRRVAGQWRGMRRN